MVSKCFKVKLQHCLLRRRKSSDVGEDTVWVIHAKARRSIFSPGICWCSHFLGDQFYKLNLGIHRQSSNPLHWSPLVSRSWRMVSFPVLRFPSSQTPNFWISFCILRNHYFDRFIYPSLIANKQPCHVSNFRT